MDFFSPSTTESVAAVAAAAVAGALTPAANQLTDERGNPTDYQINLWEQEHGRKIKQVEVGDRVVCFVQPKRHVVEAANDLLMKTKKPGRFAETIIKNCQLNYLKETAEDDELYYALTQVVDQLVTSYSVSLKN